MSDEALIAQAASTASLQVLVGLIGALKRKGLLSSAELDVVFEAALMAAERGEQTPQAQMIRLLLERLAAQIAARPGPDPE